MIDSKITWHLDNWAEWMRHGSGCAPGYSSRASGGMGNSGSRDFESMVAEVDTRCAQAVDAILADCNPAERVSVHHFHLSAVYRLNPDPDINRRLLDAAYNVARGKVARELERKGIV